MINNKLILDIANNPEKTDLFYINLDTFEVTHKAYPKVSKNRDLYKKNNSYIFDDKLFQIASSDELLNFRALDLKTDKIIKEFLVKKEDTISFKNSKIAQEKKGKILSLIKFDKSKELEKTSKLLKDISFAHLGISIYGTENNYEVLLGGTKNFDPNTGIYIALAVLSAGTLAAGGAIVTSDNNYSTSTPYNPTIYNYATYRSSKLAAAAGTQSTFIHCLFDKDLNHVKGEISPNIFDRISDFENTLEKPRAVNVFIHKNKQHYNYFDPENKIFQLYKFEKN